MGFWTEHAATEHARAVDGALLALDAGRRPTVTAAVEDELRARGLRTHSQDLTEGQCAFCGLAGDDVLIGVCGVCGGSADDDDDETYICMVCGPDCEYH
jgi:hypothetical protein